ncbi:hypothetical protein ACOSP7_013745 [Xanthoceras sorbifolium]
MLQATTTQEREVNPFAAGETSQKRILQPFSSIMGSERNHAQLKLSFPKFNGEDPQGWIYKAEQYFEFKEVSPQHRVQLASFHLKEIALQWLRWLTKFKGPLNWDKLTQSILNRFGPTEYEDPSEALPWLQQITTVTAYQEAFKKISH